MWNAAPHLSRAPRPQRKMSGAEVVNEGLSGSLNAHRARLDGRHAIEIDAPGDALDLDDGGVAAKNFSSRARRVRTNEPLSLLCSTGVPIRLDSLQPSTLVRSWFGLSSIALLRCAALRQSPFRENAVFEFHAPTWRPTRSMRLLS
jgi:hypothetical protein